MASRPKVTVGIPVCNGEPYLVETIEALRSQDLGDVQVVIADNASTDGTEEICRKVVAEDDRFVYHRSPVNRGIPFNYNRLLEFADAPYFMWNCADDLVEPTHLSRCVAALDARPDAFGAYSRVRLIDSAGTAIGTLDDVGLRLEGDRPHDRVARYFAHRAFQIVGFGGVLRTGTLREFGGLPPFYGGDVLLGMRLVMTGDLVQVPEELFIQRRHDLQMNKLQGGDPVRQQLTYNPDRGLRVAFPQWRLNYEMLAAAARAPLPVGERAAVAAALTRRWTVKNWRFFPFDIKRNIIRFRTGHYRGGYHS